MNNIPVNTMTAVFVVTFQRKPAGGVWADDTPNFNGMTSVNNGSASYDTGYINFVPATGEQWRIKVDGSYIDGQGMSHPVTPSITSGAITPNP